VFKVEQHPRLGSCVALIDKRCPSTQQIAMAFYEGVGRCIQKRTARANKRSQHLTLWRDKALLKHGALVAREHRFADAEQAVAIAHWRWNMRLLEVPRLSLPHRTRPMNASRKKDSI